MSQKSARLKRIVLTIFQASITIGVLFWVFRDPQVRANMAAALAKADFIWIFIALAIGGAQLVIGTVRWFLLLRIQDFKLSWRRVMGITMMGQFFNLFLVGATGGDLIKAWYLFREEPNRKTVAFLTIVMDRLIGLLALIAISVVIIALRYEWLMQTSISAKLLWVLILILGSALGGIVVSFLITGFKLQHKLPHRFPAREKFIELAQAYDLYAKRMGTALTAFVLSAVAHCATFYVFYLAGKAFHAKVALWDMFGVMPIIQVITALPISLSGVGVREKLFEELLGKLCGVDVGIILLISTFGFLVTVFWNLLGGVVFLMYRSSDHASLRQMRGEVETLEHQVAGEN